MRLISAGLGVLALVTFTAGCADIQQGIKEGARQGLIEGTLSVLGRTAIEEAADVRLTGELDCTAGDEPDNTPVDCSGQTEDGRKASVKGTVTAVDLGKGFARGSLTLTFDGRKLGEKDCIGLC